MTTITQEQMDGIKSKPVNEQVLFLLDLIDQGQEALEANREMIGQNLQKVFVLTVMEIATAPMATALDAANNPEIENFSDEQGKEYIKNKIVSNVVSQMAN